jgi:hypothetical protein
MTENGPDANVRRRGSGRRRAELPGAEFHAPPVAAKRKDVLQRSWPDRHAVDAPRCDLSVQLKAGRKIPNAGLGKCRRFSKHSVRVRKRA